MASGKGAGGGLRYLAVWALDENGMPLVATASANPTIPARMEMAKAFTPNFPDGVVIQFTGDDAAQGQINLPPTELSNIELRTGMANYAVDAVLQGINVVDLAGGKMLARETDKDGCLVDTFLLGYQQGIDKDPTSPQYGQRIWLYYMVPIAQVRPYAGAMEEGNARENRYVATPQKSNKYPWGVKFSEVLEGYTEATVLEGSLNGAPMLAGWLGDGYRDVFTLNPTALDIAQVRVFRWDHTTGVATDVTATVTIATNSITFPAPVSEDDLVYAFYPTAAGC
jgi:hypothetical protein